LAGRGSEQPNLVEKALRDGGTPRAAAPHSWISYVHDRARPKAVCSRLSSKLNWPPLRLSESWKTRPLAQRLRRCGGVNGYFETLLASYFRYRRSSAPPLFGRPTGRSLGAKCKARAFRLYRRHTVRKFGPVNLHAYAFQAATRQGNGTFSGRRTKVVAPKVIVCKSL